MAQWFVFQRIVIFNGLICSCKNEEISEFSGKSFFFFVMLFCILHTFRTPFSDNIQVNWHEKNLNLIIPFQRKSGFSGILAKVRNQVWDTSQR